ncbi:ATP-binding cassette domain-containing protein [Nonomuraea sp. NN258]|uniref:ABC transporter ATP-binding protein n=1 Tax=Nonomuraea antri TaxID=2730852 RepID=UPI0015683E7B|nr:ATP-binding cassette domain-containing protein [Nonomuraea antri]NRQ37039.1 ATP-binding cassette domain-containing protein [Nonomuraea antri]
MTLISVNSLSKTFGRVVAVDDLSFDVPAGAVTAFLGPNGAGKTTTLRMILGLVTPTGGGATIGGVPYRKLARPVERVGAVLESVAFHPGHTAERHLEAVCIAAGLDTERVAQVLDEVELTAARGRRIGGFSLGMRQRLALATALLGEPEALILDEPANGLDPAGMRWLRAYLRAYAHQGRTVLVSTHVLAEIEQIAEHVVIIAAGRLRWSGPFDRADGLEELYLEVAG